MQSLNRVFLIGHAGSDPDVRILPSGRKEARLSLATGNRSADHERTDWHRVTLFDRLAQVVEDRVRKDDRVFVEGFIRYGSYETNGMTIPTMEIQARELVLLESASR